MTTTEITVLALGVLLLAVVAWRLFGRRRSRRLQEHFGREYDRTVVEFKNKRRAEDQLRRRERRVLQLDIRPLAPGARERYIAAWKLCQSRFVDDPRAAVADADRLVNEVLTARGYPVADFETRAGDMSVDHPHVVAHYRAAHSIAVRHARGEAGTEDLRQAFVHYRSLFDEMLERYLVGAQ